MIHACGILYFVEASVTLPALQPRTPQLKTHTSPPSARARKQLDAGPVTNELGAMT